ncbi:MAG TPA: PmoA family protein [Ktedonobacteraceae bacterium]|nr:PmoA family protein [Ktedonobacteraceae bacterium]
MNMTLTHRLHDFLELEYHGQTLFRYVYEPDVPPRESPSPYFHPLKTLAGNEVTLFRPHDHLWHTGLSMTEANLSGENFWGGATYVREKGYVQLDNNGRIQHTAWQEITCSDNVRCTERLQWITHAGETWIDEERQITVNEIDPAGTYWSLDLAFRLKNVAQRPLIFGSPTTAGRPLAGYGSLFWRGPRSFLHGQILAAGELEGPEIMGQASPWLAFIGKHDGNGEQSTLLFIDQPGNPRFPNKWFVRNDPYACVSYSFMFDETYTLLPNETLALAYRVVLGCGAWSRAKIEEYLGAEHSRS